MQMFGKGHRLHISRDRVQFKDDLGNLIALIDLRGITFPLIQISGPIIQKLCLWLENAYREHDSRARMLFEERDDSMFMIWSDGSFTFPAYAEPFEAKPSDISELNENGIRTLSWMLRAITGKTFTTTVCGGVYTWSMPKPVQSDGSDKAGLLIPNPLLAKKGDRK